MRTGIARWYWAYLGGLSWVLAVGLVLSGCLQAQPAVLPSPLPGVPVVSSSPVPTQALALLPRPLNDVPEHLPSSLTGPLSNFTINNDIRADYIDLPFQGLLIWTGITWDGAEHIWVANNEMKVIVGFSIPKAKQERMVPFPSDLKTPATVTGLTWDGAHFWIADAEHQMIYQIDALTGKTLRGFAYSGLANGLVWDGDSLWLVSQTNRALEHFSAEGERLGSLSIPGNWPSGLAWDGRYFWYSDANQGAVYLLNPATGKVSEVTAFKFMMNQGTFNGLAWMHGYLWIVTEFHERLHRVDVSQLDWKTLEAALQ